MIGQMTATDRDEKDTLHTELKYRMVSQDPVSLQHSKMFDVNRDTGAISLAFPGLDREVIVNGRPVYLFLLV